MLIRLNKYLASRGVASRRQVDQMIDAGLVKVNSKVVTPGTKVDPDHDQIMVKQQLLTADVEPLVYYLLNKPLGVISTARDALNRQTAVSLIQTKTRIFPVGRLDQDTEGLLILTNDGELTNFLTHPKYHLPKTYRLTLSKSPAPAVISKLATGVKLSDGLTAPAEVKLIETNPAILELTIFEGRNRQIRRMCGALNIDLQHLQRIQMGPINLGDLEPGQFRLLSNSEIDQLRQLLPSK